jgi:hypothetical protein
MKEGKINRKGKINSENERGLKRLIVASLPYPNKNVRLW